MGFINFYRTLIRKYSQIIELLYQFIKKSQSFNWFFEAEYVFQTLKKRITKRSIIKKADPKKSYEVETDISDKAMEIALKQRNEKGRFYLIAFFSKKFQKTEWNYFVYDKKLMVIVITIKKWKVYFAGISYTIKVYSNYKNLVYFTKTKNLNGRHFQ